MANTRKSRKILKSKEIEYGSTKRKYIDKSLEETLKKSGFERKPKMPKPRDIMDGKKIDPDNVKIHLPKNIDSEILIKPERKTKKAVAKQEERRMEELPSHLEFEAPETIKVSSAIKRIVDDAEGAEYGDLPEEIDVVHDDTKEEKNKKKKSIFSTIKQTLGFSDDEASDEEDLEKKKAELKRQIEKKEGKPVEEIQYIAKKEMITDDDDNIVRPSKLPTSSKEEEPVEQLKEIKKEVINDEDEMGLEPIKFTDKIKNNQEQYFPQEEPRQEKPEVPSQAPEVLQNDVEDEDSDSSMDIMYSKPKKKQKDF